MPTKDIYIGTMSGTSADAVESCALNIDKKSITIIGSYSTKITSKDQTKILNLAAGKSSTVQDFGEINQSCTRYFLKSIQGLIRKNFIKHSKIKGIGLSGQTVWHAPKSRNPFSIQLGDPNYISHALGVPVVSDFRNSHIALGGEGAPLTTYFHHEMFRSQKSRLIINLGGITNFTFLKKSFVLGSDAGPANALMDIYCQKVLKKKFDKGGEVASKGNIHKSSINEMSKHFFFRKKLPKSTGKEIFNFNFIPKKLLKQSKEDVLATLNFFSAMMIFEQTQKLKKAIDEIYVCGGGIKNQTLVCNLESLFKTKIKSSKEIGLDPMLVESAAFGWLAKKRMDREMLQVLNKDKITKGLLGSITKIR